MNADEIEWVEELPPKKNDIGKFAPLREELRANPGKWAKIDVTAPTITRINQGMAPWQGFEGARRDGVSYVRYVGDDRG